jgi:tetratricopeptide (TPR) repeat protein
MSFLKFENKGSIIFCASLCLVFLAMTGMSFFHGISGDEPDMNLYGKAILRYFASFGEDDWVFSGDRTFDRDGVIKYYGGLFDFIAALVNKISPLGEFTTRHILNAWAGFLAIFFSSKIAKRLHGYQLATMVVWLMFLSPFFLGQAMNNPKDVPFAAAYIMALWCIIRLFDRLEQATWKDYLWAVLAIGAAINIRVGGILLIPYLFVLAVLYLMFKKGLRKEEFHLKSLAKPIGILTAGGYFAGGLLWPFALQDPISNPIIALQELSNFKMNLAQIWEGQKVWSNELPTFYLIKAFGITNTFVFLIGLVLGIVFAFTRLKKKDAELLFFVGFTGIFPVAYIMYSGSNVYHAWRHVLFIFPPLAIVAAGGWYYFGQLFKGKLQYVGVGLFALLLLEPLYFTARTFPNTNTYYNALVGGVSGAYGNYEVDFYYNSVKEVVDWFMENEYPQWKEQNPGDTLILSTNAYFTVHEYTRPIENLKAGYLKYQQRNQKDWDYLLLHIALIPLRDIETGNWIPEGMTLYQAQVDDNAMCVLLKRKSNGDVKGSQFMAQGQYDNAINSFEDYLKHDPRNTDILNQLANAYLSKGDLKGARAAADRSLKADSEKLETKNLLGVIALQSGDANTAIQMFSQVLAQNKEFWQGYYFLALAQKELGQNDLALKNFKTASEGDQNLKVSCYQNMAEIYQNQGKTEQVQRLMQLIQENQNKQ